MNTNTPVIFADGTAFYNELSKDYVKHPRGLFILAPSGTGKTYYVKNQIQKDWIDGDYLWPLSGADNSGEEWGDDAAIIEIINIRSDIITNQATKLGFWIIGSSNSNLRPDAIVLPPWRTHLSYIKIRESTLYDGGATSKDIQGVRKHRKIISKWKRKGVPCFKSIEEAVAKLSADTYPHST